MKNQEIGTSFSVNLTEYPFKIKIEINLKSRIIKIENYIFLIALFYIFIMEYQCLNNNCKTWLIILIKHRIIENQFNIFFSDLLLIERIVKKIT